MLQFGIINPLKGEMYQSDSRTQCILRSKHSTSVIQNQYINVV